MADEAARCTELRTVGQHSRTVALARDHGVTCMDARGEPSGGDRSYGTVAGEGENGATVMGSGDTVAMASRGVSKQRKRARRTSRAGMATGELELGGAGRAALWLAHGMHRKGEKGGTWGVGHGDTGAAMMVVSLAESIRTRKGRE